MTLSPTAVLTAETITDSPAPAPEFSLLDESSLTALDPLPLVLLDPVVVEVEDDEDEEEEEDEETAAVVATADVEAATEEPPIA